ncbi:MAG: TetR/AcrR family transcriptional regulator, partial [Acidobacteria bacterium]|nr:TetR/AcrR family transcriptional regulator [Acidobacteriota bacterium]
MSRTLEMKGANDAGERPTPASGRMAGEDRRRQILEVAMTLFSQRGFRGTTTKEIAQAASVSEAMVFRHFANKGELYAAILDQKACHTSMMEGICAGLTDVMQRGDDAEVFAGIGLGILQHHEEDLDFIRLLLYSALEGHEFFQMFWERNVCQMADFMRGYIHQRQQDGAFRQQIDPLIVARMFTGTIINHSLVNLLFDPKRTLLDVSNERAAQVFSEILLKGISADAKANVTAAAS